mgnify:CR=1 FL=1
MGSPIDNWEGAAAVFTGANGSMTIALALIVTVALCIGPIVYSATHENDLYKKHS